MEKERIVRFIQKVFDEVVAKLPEKDQVGRIGGFVTVQEIGSNKPCFTAKIVVKTTELTEEEEKKFESWEFNSREKASRLSALAAEEGHISSWQSRDFDNKKYGGAVESGGYVFSFSGLPEIGDEYLMIMVMYELGFIVADRIQRIVTISGNQLIPLAA